MQSHNRTSHQHQITLWQPNTPPSTSLPHPGFVIHGTSGLTLSDNTAFHATGSCYYLEVGGWVCVGVWVRLRVCLGVFAGVFGGVEGGGGGGGAGGGARDSSQGRRSCGMGWVRGKACFGAHSRASSFGVYDDAHRLIWRPCVFPSLGIHHPLHPPSPPPPTPLPPPPRPLSFQDGVEERNVLRRNLGAFVHVIGNPAGGVTQSGELFVQVRHVCVLKSTRKTCGVCVCVCVCMCVCIVMWRGVGAGGRRLGRPSSSS